MQWFRSNSSLKIVSLVLAIAGWYFVKNITSERRVVEGIPVEVRVPDNRAVTGLSDAVINVILSGTRADIWQVSHFEMVAVVDLSHEDHVGKIKVPLDPRMIRHPNRVQVMQVVPSFITVNLAGVTNGASSAGNGKKP